MTVLLLLVAGAVAVAALMRVLGDRDSPPAGRAEPPHEEGEELVELISSTDLVAIDAYREALRSAGIPVRIFDEAVSRILGRLPAVGARMMVPASRLAEARAIVDDFEPGTFARTDER